MIVRRLKKAIIGSFLICILLSGCEFRNAVIPNKDDVLEICLDYMVIEEDEVISSNVTETQDGYVVEIETDTANFTYQVSVRGIIQSADIVSK